MPNQNECDHIVVESAGYTVPISDLSAHIKLRMTTRFNARARVTQYSFMQFFDGRHGLMEKFNYCPNCGAKIDWDKIKEELDEQ